MADTGNTSTIAFGTTTGFTPAVTVIGGLEETLEALEISDLATATDKEYQPDDLRDREPITCQYQYDQSAGTFCPLGVVETITITYGLKSGEATAATLAGSGFVRRRKSGDIQNGELMIGEFDVFFDGITGPTYTAGSA